MPLCIQEAIDAWKSPLFGPHYHQTGYVVCATGRAPSKAVEHLENALLSIESDPAFASGVHRLHEPKDFRELTWQYSGPLTGFRGYYNRLAGYAHSSDALRGAWEECVRLGVKFIQDENTGKVTRLVYDEGMSTSNSTVPSRRKCIGVETADGTIHFADLTICAVGAHVAHLLPEAASFVAARCWSVAHVQLNEQETNFLRGIPTTNVRDLGFFFEPDPKTRLFKLCPLGVGYTNTREDGASLPPPECLPPPQNYIPVEDERKLRHLLRETFPWMADRPFIDQKLCWFADTADSDYCLDYVPNTHNSVICLSGDSGHGFKMMPIFGRWVVDLVAKGKQQEQRWQWKSSSGTIKDWGEAVSWRIGSGRELSELVEEKEKLERARL